MSIKTARLPEDTVSIQHLLKFIDLSHYPSLSEIQNPEHQWFVYQQNGAIIGCVAATKDRGEIRHIVVEPTSCRKGIGSQLLNKAVVFLRNIGYRHVWAQVRIDNKKSQGLFRKAGFRQETRVLPSPENSAVKLNKFALDT